MLFSTETALVAGSLREGADDTAACGQKIEDLGQSSVSEEEQLRLNRTTVPRRTIRRSRKLYSLIAPSSDTAGAG